MMRPDIWALDLANCLSPVFPEAVSIFQLKHGAEINAGALTIDQAAATLRGWALYQSGRIAAAKRGKVRQGAFSSEYTEEGSSSQAEQAAFPTFEARQSDRGRATGRGRRGRGRFQGLQRRGRSDSLAQETEREASPAKKPRIEKEEETEPCCYCGDVHAFPCYWAHPDFARPGWNMKPTWVNLVKEKIRNSPSLKARYSADKKRLEQ